MASNSLMCHAIFLCLPGGHSFPLNWVDESGQGIHMGPVNPTDPDNFSGSRISIIKSVSRSTSLCTMPQPQTLGCLLCQQSLELERA